MMIDRRLITNFDWILLALVLLVCGCGIVNLYSAASNFGGSTPIFMKQVYWLGIALAAMVVIAFIGYQRLCSLSILIYLAVCGLLLAVLLWGKMVGGSQRWLSLGPFALQPSELARLAVILMLSYYFQRKDQNEPYNLRQLVIPVILALAPALLILKEPDLGTSLMVLSVAFTIILVNGVKLSSLGIAAGGLLLFLPLGWRFMEDYQKKRIFSFLDPESDPLGASYHLIQSKIAVGSGGFAGKGFMAGTQTQLNFLPEQHTDFAFSVLAEEWGFLGGTLVLALIAIIIARALMHALRSKDRQGMLIVAGATATIFWPAIINVGMVLGLFPVVGIPLPFVSYGGSHLVSAMISIGLIESVAMRRFVFHRPV